MQSKHKEMKGKLGIFSAFGKGKKYAGRSCRLGRKIVGRKLG